MAKFEGLDTPKGLGSLNQHLADRSYIEGYTPSSADVEVFSQINAAPDSSKNPHVARWWNHIASFAENERKAWAAPVAETKAAAPIPAEKKEDDFDLFGEDSAADDEWEKEVQRRADEHAAKKKAAGKGPGVLKSAIIIDVKPWDDTTDLAELEKLVRGIEMDGLEWKASKLVAIGYGIKKLQISCHVEDDKVSVDDIQDKIAAYEDFVQSTDISSFTKL
uniref:Predicted protein n=1 Tax=Hordeum vulgare subsp. vulgare TaxID=112509 RepID=F2DWZ3_HORVV|nr:predicted protein [Hordeum vulgare subsp. vulgare]